MIIRHMAVSMIPETIFHILKIMNVPVILIQCILDQFLVLLRHSHPQQQIGGHKQSIRPALLRKIIAGGNRVLKNPVPKPQCLLSQILHLTHDQITVTAITGGFKKCQKTVPHGAFIHRPYLRYSQSDVFVNPFLQKREILLIPRCLIRPANPVIGHAAGPVPGHVHPHGSPHNPVGQFYQLLLFIV